MPKVPLPPAEPMVLESLAEVARGGMGSVELARVMDGRLAGQVLAVKRLHPNIAEDPEFVSMFLDEAWMTAALKHTNVAQVVAWGNDEHGMFLAIELVQGVSLSRLMKESQQNQEPFAERTVAYLCSQLCAGLVAAHTLKAPDGAPLGLVHRDLTPANVLISFDGLVKIIDFGIAKAEERISHTRTGQLKGKPAYMAPEQQRGQAVDARADIFAFGVVMYEMLAGRRPWTAKGAFDVMMEISNDPHPDLGELRKGLNPEFVAIAHKCLEKKPENRFQTAQEIKSRLDAWLSARGFSSDDQQSLANFVLRNSQPQVLWWQEALRGEHNKKKAPTFKELEEKIDEERERAAKAARKAAAAPPPRPAAGKMSGTVPMPAYTGDAAPPSSMMQPPSSMLGPPSSVNPASAQGPSSMQMPASMPHRPASGAQFKAVSLAGTEFMAMSPYAASGPPAAPPAPAHRSGEYSPMPPSQAYPQPSSAPPSSGQQPYGPPSPQPQSQPAPAIVALACDVPPGGTESGTIPMQPGIAEALLAKRTVPLAPGADVGRITGGVGGAPLPVPPAPPPPVAAAPAPQKKSRLGAIVVVLLVLIAGGVGIALSFMTMGRR